LDTLIAKETKEGVGCDNMTAILIAFNWFDCINRI
jgi:serine/threonine protein phosphatase PrpC